MSRLFSPFRAQHQFLQKYLKFKIALFQLKGHGNFLKEHQRSECLSSFFGAPGAYICMGWVTTTSGTCPNSKAALLRLSQPLSFDHLE